MEYRQLPCGNENEKFSVLGLGMGGIGKSETAIELIKRNSRRYAKRQLTWFRRDCDVAWFAPSSVGAIIEYIDDRVR